MDVFTIHNNNLASTYMTYNQNYRSNRSSMYSSERDIIEILERNNIFKNMF